MDNFDILKQNLDIAIDPNAGIGQILAQKHNDYVTEFMSKQGKYVGSPFTAKAIYQGVANPGELFLNGALNDVNGLGIITSKLTNDLNDFGIVLQTLSSGDLIHFKDYVGRSCYFVFKSFFATNDNNNNEIYQIDVTPNANNINYTYQANESKICVLETLKSKSKSIVENHFENIELNLFWNGRGWNDNQASSEYSKFVDLYKFVAKDQNLTFCKTVNTKVYFLGIEFKDYEKLKDLNPQLVIERYKRAHQNRTNSNPLECHKSPSMYRSTNFYNTTVFANIYNPSQNVVSGDYITRHQIISLGGSRQYYDINAENYFSQVDTPKALGNQNFKTYPKNTTVSIEDDSKRYSRKGIPKRQKGYVHCRLRIRIDVSGKGDFLYSPVLAYFKIKNQLIWSDNNEVQSSIINYSYE